MPCSLRLRRWLGAQFPAPLKGAPLRGRAHAAEPHIGTVPRP
ncbi:hypothetical protein [Streptomyces sp. NPDC048172]